MFEQELSLAKDYARRTANDLQVPTRIYRVGDRYRICVPWAGRPDGAKLIRTVPPQYRVIEDVKKRNEANGGKWFDPSYMRFFGTRIQSAIYVHKDGRAFFVTSERDRYQGEGGGAWGGRRLYSVRVANVDGSIDTVGEFGAYTTGRAAHKAARLASES
ncbi:MAG TPA: hypothetical protein VJ725_21555 [Thermoanaerobaculia bacterium]|nr:hypothetical protein [Thermoanaerobaculia bacterium]